MGKTHFQPSQGVRQWGAILNQYEDGRASGNVFYVCSVAAGAGDTAGHGFTPEDAFVSIGFALTQCVANNDDMIVVLPGHVESIGASGLSVNVAGVTIHGQQPGGLTPPGAGRGRGSIGFSNAAGSINVSAANVTLDNLVVTGVGVAAATAMLTVTGADCVINNCEIELANATNQAVLGVSATAAANRLCIRNCHFHGTNNAGVTAAVQLVGGSDARIEQNRFVGAFTSGVGAISNITTATVNTFVSQNVIQNLTAACTKALTFVAGSTGQINQNWMQILSGTAPITAAGMSWVGGNYYAAALATAGTLI